jgi:protocatechuate 3,4-dioxygenase beta subunit
MNLITVRKSLSCRREFLRRMATAAPFWAVPGAFAEALLQTPKQTEGPFYPDKLPLDTDNDLLVINDGTTPAIGDVTWLSGRILGPDGQPIRNALVEIWQCDSTGVYRHTGSGGDQEKRDRNFQSFGRFLTGSTGEYVFRTIKPVSYPGRAPHIHFAVKMKGREKWTTQCYVKDHPQNAADGIWKNLGSPEKQAAVTVPFAALEGSRTGELSARFEIVMGYTPEG